MTWSEVEASRLVAGARMLTEGIGAPRIRIVRSVEMGERMLIVTATDGWGTAIEPTAVVWARLPDGAE